MADPEFFKCWFRFLNYSTVYTRLYGLFLILAVVNLTLEGEGSATVHSAIILEKRLILRMRLDILKYFEDFSIKCS